MKAQILFIISSMCLLCSGCSSTNPGSTMPKDFSVSELAMYTSRASMHSLDFEQYKLLKGRLYQECGVIRGGRPVPVHQELFEMSDREYSELMEFTWHVLSLAHEGTAQFAEPGSSDTMFDPGKLLLSISGNGNTMKVSTNLDSIVEPTNKAEEAVQQLARKVRALAKPAACGNQSFYGLGFER